MQISGHKTESTFRRYRVVDEADISGAARLAWIIREGSQASLRGPQRAVSTGLEGANTASAAAFAEERAQGRGTCSSPASGSGRRATPLPRAGAEADAPTGSGRRADRARNLPPRTEPRKGRRQGQHDPAHRALDPHRELDQPLAQGRHL